MLSDEQIVAAISTLYAERRVALIALAASRDEYHAIESAACAERDARIAELEQQRDAAWEALAKIGDFAHDRSTGPAVPDALWEIRAMAYTAAGPAISAAIKEQT